MTQALEFFLEMFEDLLNLLDIKFELFGLEVSYLSIVICFIIISMVVGIWWKGARG